MGDFITRPFPGSAIPFLFDEMGRDEANEDFRTVCRPPSSLWRIKGIPHTQGMIRITVGGFFGAIDEYARHSG